MIQYKELKKNLKKDLSGFPEIKVSVVGDTATQFLATAIRGLGVERGLNINLFEAEYNQVDRQFLDPTIRERIHYLFEIWCACCPPSSSFSRVLG